MQQDYSHLKLSALNIKEHEKIMVNALGFFRGNGKKKPRYPMPMLFQMAAFSERFFTLQVHHERATPPTQMTEEEVYDPVFAEKLDFFTQEFIDACQACLPVMDSVHSITPSVVSIAQPRADSPATVMAIASATTSVPRPIGRSVASASATPNTAA